MLLPSLSLSFSTNSQFNSIPSTIYNAFVFRCFHGGFLMPLFHSTQMFSWPWPISLFQRKSSLHCQSLILFLLSLNGSLLFVSSFVNLRLDLTIILFYFYFPLLVPHCYHLCNWLKFYYLIALNLVFLAFPLVVWIIRIISLMGNVLIWFIWIGLMTVYQHSLYISLFPFEPMDWLYKTWTFLRS